MRHDTSVVKSHAVMDARSRTAKAHKIIHLISQVQAIEANRVLEIGCGSGHISRTLSDATGDDGYFCALDVTDERRVQDFEFRLYDGEHMPFPDSSFDVVVSNHTLEHVGDDSKKAAHVLEISRVLAPNGLLYIAMPNRLHPFEAHYRLPCLSWLPRKAADVYVRLAKRGEVFDVWPTSRRRLYRMLVSYGFEVFDRTPEAFRFVCRNGEIGRLPGALSVLPRPILSLLGRVMPTAVFVARLPDSRRK